ncbi:ABC transporter permease [Sulfitobacter sp. G21635-S1]|uniref:ABC transporter permease n=1 Tax=Sulfitobacter sp. G21635-S1 TaxID=3014043 RepID=UPI0022AEFA6F|nr:ABC transporter permease [Sulfitobacter sp. G21635-S1]
MKQAGRWGYLLPLLCFVVFAFDLPVLRMLLVSVDNPADRLSAFRELFATPVYLRVVVITFKIAFATAVLCGLFGYILAYWIYTMQSARWRMFFLGTVGMTFWISILARTYAWIVILGNNGLINRTLLELNIVNAPVSLIYNEVGILIGTVNVLLPIVVLPLYAAMSGLDGRLLAAARSLGASELRVFWQIFFPLTLPALAAGSMLVFILTLGFFVTPAILGGNRVPMVATVLDSFINVISEWQLAAALSSTLLLITVLLYFFYKKLLGMSSSQQKEANT